MPVETPVDSVDSTVPARDAEPAATPAADECYRCGYALRGIADDQPCPECGLLALRSRRVTDELHDTRPRWLRRMAMGVRLMLYALVFTVVWPFLIDPLDDRLGNPWSAQTYAIRARLPLLGFDAAAVLLLAGACLLTSREGYGPADRADRRLRVALRLAAAAPLLALALAHLHIEEAMQSPRFRFGSRAEWSPFQVGAVVVATLGCVPLPLLLFRQLRGLAVRARSAHLAEHCTIVGVGTSLTLVYVAAFTLLFENAERWGLGHTWHTRSQSALALMLVLSVAAVLFPLWSLYLLTRFALAFRRAARHLRARWTQDDRSLAAPVP